MSQFLTDLVVEEVLDSSPVQDGRSTWRLLQPLIYQSDIAARTITVPTGFVTDYASVPRIPVAWYLAGGEAPKPAVVHDYLYTSHELPRATADAVFREAMAVVGQPAWRRWLMWAGVRLGGAAPFEADYQTKGASQ